MTMANQYPESDQDEADLRTKLREAMESLASGPASVVGLVVDYRGWSMQLLAVNVEEDDAYGPYKWQATTTADPIDDGPCDCVGRGMTPMEALDRCADEAEDAESFDDDDCIMSLLRGYVSQPNAPWIGPSPVLFPQDEEMP